MVGSGDGRASGEVVGRIQSEPDYIDLRVPERLHDGNAPLHRLVDRVFLIQPRAPHLLERRGADDHGRIYPHSRRAHRTQFPSGRERLFRRVAGEARHHLEDHIKAGTFDELRRALGVGGLMAPAGKAQDLVVHGLRSELDRLNSVCFEQRDRVRVDLIRPR